MPSSALKRQNRSPRANGATITAATDGRTSDGKRLRDLLAAFRAAYRSNGPADAARIEAAAIITLRIERDVEALARHETADQRTLVGALGDLHEVEKHMRRKRGQKSPLPQQYLDVFATADDDDEFVDSDEPLGTPWRKGEGEDEGGGANG